MASQVEWDTYSRRRRRAARLVCGKSRIAFAVERLFFALQYISPASRLRGTETDSYILVWAVAAAALITISSLYYPALPSCLIWITFGSALLRVADLSQFTVNLALFDRLGVPRLSGTSVQPVQDLTRSLVLLLWNFLELIIWFGLVYVSAPFAQCGLSFGSRFYFSVVTQLTIGYGDITPVEWARGVAVTQGVLGWLVTVVVISRLVASLPVLRGVVGRRGSGAAQQ